MKDDENRALVNEIFDTFEREVIPVQDRLDVGYMHGDFNEQNIIVDSRGDIHGVIDFGDSQKNPLVYDIAIAIMYMMTKVPFQIGIINSFDISSKNSVSHGSPLWAPNKSS